VRSDFGLPRSADHLIAGCASWKQFRFSAEALCFFGKSFFK
jgi:hypothetical protein